MKRFCLYSPVALLTLLIGVLLAGTRAAAPVPPALAPNTIEHVRVKLLQVSWRESNYRIGFEVLNGSSEPLRYRSYSKHDHCAFMIKREGRVEEQVPCFCGTGLAEQTLLPGEAATYYVSLGPGFGDVKVGFDFLVAGGRKKEVAWSDNISLP